jgi:hypothetical protein
MVNDFIKRLIGSDDESTSEKDVPTDTGVAASRTTGGVEDDSEPDQMSTTGTTPDEEYVGRVAGQDVGYAGETGAEVRAEADRQAKISQDKNS